MNMEKTIDANQSGLLRIASPVSNHGDVRLHLPHMVDVQLASPLHVLSPLQILQKMYFIDGCFDGYHYGHVNALFQAKQLCDILVLGTHTDDEMKEFKNIPLFNYEERIFMLQYCRYIDKIVDNVPYISTLKTVRKYNCSHYVHGDEVVLTNKNVSALEEELKKYYKTYAPTEGISTSNLLVRMYYYFKNKLGSSVPIPTNKNTIYLNSIINNLKESNRARETLVGVPTLYLYHSWDMFCSEHIKVILMIKDMYPDHKIIACVSNELDLIYNQLERAIVLYSIKIIDDVIIEPSGLSSMESNGALEDKEWNNIVSGDNYINLYDKFDNLYFNKDLYISTIINNINIYEQKLNKELSKMQPV